MTRDLKQLLRSFQNRSGFLGAVLCRRINESPAERDPMERKEGCRARSWLSVSGKGQNTALHLAFGAVSGPTVQQLEGHSN